VTDRRSEAEVGGRLMIDSFTPPEGIQKLFFHNVACFQRTKDVCDKRISLLLYKSQNIKSKLFV
jgi:hypothetical protein